MFNKRTDTDDSRHEEPDLQTDPPRAPASPRAADLATIGPSIRLTGDLTGEEDLVVQGKVEGTINLSNNLLTIGKDGHVSATVNARVIKVEGKVDGDLNGNEQVIVRRSGNVQGNIVAPRVTLEDGCRFKGSIDMDVSSNGARTGNVADIKPAVDGGQTKS